jgi:hypothetical protein
VAKFPISPGASVLARLEPSTSIIPIGTRLARLYYAGGRHPMLWNAFRHVGSVNARWDHHRASSSGEEQFQERGIYYAARDATTCLAEAFQQTRRIDRAYQAPWLVVFTTVSPLLVLDLTCDFAARIGASMALHSGSRERARGWSRDLYEAFHDSQGIQYSLSMNGSPPALALNERALKTPLFPPHPLLHRALADDVMLDPLKLAARALGYALR